MLRLATIALLLLALVPTLIRIGGHAGPDGSHGGSCAMPSMHGHGPSATAIGQANLSNDDDGGVCAYCPLLASLALLAFILLVLPPVRLPGWISANRTFAPRRAMRHPCGLGSRGPPLRA